MNNTMTFAIIAVLLVTAISIFSLGGKGKKTNNAGAPMAMVVLLALIGGAFWSFTSLMSGGGDNKLISYATNFLGQHSSVTGILGTAVRGTLSAVQTLGYAGGIGWAIVGLALVAMAIGLFGARMARGIVLLSIYLLAGFMSALSIVAIPVGWLIGRMAPSVDNALNLGRALDTVIVKIAHLQGSWLALASLRDIAHRWWPSDANPELYTSVPGHIQRRAYTSGRVIGDGDAGYDPMILADRMLTDDAINHARIDAVNVVLTADVAILAVWAWLLMGAVSLGAIFSALGLVALSLAFVTALIVVRPMGRKLAISSGILVAMFGLAAMMVSVDTPTVAIETWGRDAVVSLGWMSAPGVMISSLLSNLWSSLMAALGPVATIFACTIGAVIANVGMMILVTQMRIASYFRLAGKPWTYPTHDGEARYIQIIDKISQSAAGYREMITHALSERVACLPLIKIGSYDGSMGVNGVLGAPSKGMPAYLSIDDLLMNMIVLGPTGSGKTQFFKAMLARLLLAIDNLGVFMIEAKGDLWMKFAEVAESVGRGKDVRVIGCKEGMCSVDPFAEVSPNMAGTLLYLTMKQMGLSSTSDPYFDQAASDLIIKLSTIGHYYAKTPYGQREAAETNVNPYSLWWVYLVSQDRTKLQVAIEVIVNAYEDKQQWEDLGQFVLDSEELRRAVDYLRGEWVRLADSTKSCVVSNVNNLLSSLGSSQELCDAFAKGAAPLDKTVSLREILYGKERGLIGLVAISTTEYGLGAKLLLTYLGTKFNNEVRLRLVREGEAFCRKNPRLLIKDECQEVVTTGSKFGISDDEFFNTNRSAGVFGIYATQSIKALMASIGDADKVQNMLSCFRNKMFIGAEDEMTVGYASFLAGKHMRAGSIPGVAQSLEHRIKEEGFDVTRPEPSQREVETLFNVINGNRNEGFFRNAMAVSKMLMGFADVMKRIAFDFSKIRRYNVVDFLMAPNLRKREIYEPNYTRLSAVKDMMGNRSWGEGTNDQGEIADIRIEMMSRAELESDSFGNSAFATINEDEAQAAAVSREILMRGGEVADALDSDALLQIAKGHVFLYSQNAGGRRFDMVTLDNVVNLNEEAA